jgi:hypothetical protein
MAAWIQMVVNLPAVVAPEQQHGLSIAISDNPPLQRAWSGELIRTTLEIVLTMATVLCAELGDSIFERH